VDRSNIREKKSTEEEEAIMELNCLDVQYLT
jgi:hypothetical protein